MPGREGAGLCHGAGGPSHGLHRHRGQHAAGEDLSEGLGRLPPGEPTRGQGAGPRGAPWPQAPSPFPSLGLVVMPKEPQRFSSVWSLPAGPHWITIFGLGSPHL